MEEKFSPEKGEPKKITPAITPDEIVFQPTTPPEDQTGGTPAPATPAPLPPLPMPEPEPVEPPAPRDENTYIKEAEKIITKYADDPHEEEEEASELQREFLKEKFGKDVKEEGDGPTNG